MTAQELLKSGDVAGAAQVVANELRNNPADLRLRTFFFELLCFSGDYDRASRQLGILSQEGSDAVIGALLLRSALAAAQQREHNFANGLLPQSKGAEPRAGTLNGQSFQTIEDADERIGSHLEVFIAGECVWLPFAHVGALTVEPPRLLRDTIWPPARVTTSADFQGREFGEVILPVLYPFSSKHENGAVKLGRETVWGDDGIPFGQKLLLLDGEQVVPYLEIRELRFLDVGTGREEDLAQARAEA